MAECWQLIQVYYFLSLSTYFISFPACLEAWCALYLASRQRNVNGTDVYWSRLPVNQVLFWGLGTGQSRKSKSLFSLRLALSLREQDVKRRKTGQKTLVWLKPRSVNCRRHRACIFCDQSVNAERWRCWVLRNRSWWGGWGPDGGRAGQGVECNRKAVFSGVWGQSPHAAGDPESGLDWCFPGT